MHRIFSGEDLLGLACPEIVEYRSLTEGRIFEENLYDINLNFETKFCHGIHVNDKKKFLEWKRSIDWKQRIKANQLSGFYMRATLTFNELRQAQPFSSSLKTLNSGIIGSRNIFMNCLLSRFYILGI